MAGAVNAECSSKAKHHVVAQVNTFQDRAFLHHRNFNFLILANDHSVLATTKFLVIQLHGQLNVLHNLWVSNHVDSAFSNLEVHRANRLRNNFEQRREQVKLVRPGLDLHSAAALVTHYQLGTGH